MSAITMYEGWAKERKKKRQLSQTHLNIQRFLSAASDKDSFM